MIKTQLRSLFAYLLLFICLAALLPAQTTPAKTAPAQTTDEWQKYKNADFNFSTIFPCTPKDGPIPGSDGGQPSVLTSCIVGSTAYMAIVQSSAEEMPLTDEAFETYAAGFFKVMPKKQIVKEEAASPALPDSVGKLYHFSFEPVDGTRLNAVGNLYLRKHYAYGVMVAYPEANPEPATVKKFLGAFVLLDSSK